MVEEEKSEGDVFTEAFDTLAKTGELPAPVASAPPEAVASETPAVDDGSEVPAADQGAGEAGDNPDEPVVADAGDGDAKAEAPAPKEPEKAPDQDIIDRLAQAVKEKVQPPQPQYEQPPQAYEPPPVLTQDDYKQLEAFEKDWPDVAKAMDLRAKEQAHAIVNHIFKEFAQEFRPVAQQVMAMRQQMHVQELHTRVNDYEDIRDKVVDWANKQPDYLRGAYQHVIQRGTPEQVQDLITRYRQENAPPPAAAQTQVAAPPKQLSPAVKKAAEKLAPVQSKRSHVVRGDDPNDFDGAFEQWAKAQ